MLTAWCRCNFRTNRGVYLSQFFWRLSANKHYISLSSFSDLTRAPNLSLWVLINAWGRHYAVDGEEWHWTDTLECSSSLGSSVTSLWAQYCSCVGTVAPTGPGVARVHNLCNGGSSGLRHYVIVLLGNLVRHKPMLHWRLRFIFIFIFLSLSSLISF